MRRLILAAVIAFAIGGAARPAPVSATAPAVVPIVAHGTFTGSYRYACSPYGCILRPVYASCVYASADGRRWCWDYHTH